MIKRSVFVLMILLLSVPAVHAQDDPCIQKGGMLDETQHCQIKAGINLEIGYPLELAQYPIAEETIDAFLMETRTNFLTNFMDYGLTYPSPGPWSLYISYETYPFSDSIISIKFDIADYTGGAHGNLVFQTFVFDVAQNTLLTFDDIFPVDPLPTLAPLVQEQIAANMGEFADTQWIQEGTGVNPENYQNFVVTQQSVIFFFPPYQVAPYAAGPQTAEIPFTQINALLAPPFVQ